MDANFPSATAPFSKRLVITVVVVVVALALVLLGVVLLLGPRPIAAPSTTTAPAEPTITITKSGFSPTSLKVKAGTTVQWINDTARPHGVESNPYPQHTDLPGLYTATPLAPGTVYEYTFTAAGTWGYNDPTEPTMGGTVVVQ